jgi:1,4-alpha-glucan branching enzyme
MRYRGFFAVAPVALACLSAATAARYAGLLRSWDPRSFQSLPGAAPGAEGVRFTLYAPQARSASLAGDFNGWKEQPLREDDRGAWEALLPLSSGTYRYLFHVDDEWLLDPAARKTQRMGPLTVSVRSSP